MIIEFANITIGTKKLTDGSLVYEIILSDETGGNVMILQAADEKGSWAIYQAIQKHAIH